MKIRDVIPSFNSFYPNSTDFFLKISVLQKRIASIVVIIFTSLSITFSEIGQLFKKKFLVKKENDYQKSIQVQPDLALSNKTQFATFIDLNNDVLLKMIKMLSSWDMHDLSFVNKNFQVLIKSPIIAQHLCQQEIIEPYKRFKIALRAASLHELHIDRRDRLSEEQFIQIFKMHPQLKKVSCVGCCEMTDNVLEHLPNITSLDISYCRALTVEGIKKLGPLLSTLDISACDNLYEPHSFLSMVELLPSNLNTLRMNTESSEFYRIYSKIDIKKFPPASTLACFECNIITDQMISFLPNLKSLDCFALNISNGGIKNFSSKLNNFTLKKYIFRSSDELSKFKELRSLELISCKLEILKNISNKISNLQIINCNLNSIETIPNHAKKVIIRDCPSLKKIQGVSSQLKKLDLIRCGKLTQLDIVTEKITSLTLMYCNKLKINEENFRSLKRLVTNHQFVHLNLYTELISLTISNPKLKDIEVCTKRLRKLILNGCDDLFILDKGLFSSTLTFLEINDMQFLHTINSFSPNLNTLLIQHCKNLKKIKNLPENLTYLRIVNCPKLKTIKLPSNLRYFDISDCNEIDFGTFPPNLRKLIITNCKKYNDTV